LVEDTLKNCFADMNLVSKWRTSYLIDQVEPDNLQCFRVFLISAGYDNLG